MTKERRQLTQTPKKYDLVIINKEVCKTLWTRKQGQERSVLDYVQTNNKLLSTVTEVIIDENKQYSVFKLKKVEKHTHTTMQYK